MAARFDFLVDALNKIQIKESNNLSFNEIYFLGYEIVRRRETLKLYNHVKDVIKNHLSSRIRPKITDDLKQSEIESLVKAWDDHETCLQCFRKLLFFLDRDVTRRLCSQNIQNLGVEIFKSEVFEPNRDILQSILLETVQAERNGQRVSSSPVKRVVDIILTVTDINHYETYFEELFLKDSERYYQMRLQNHIESDDTLDYINWYNKYVLDEKSRVARYLHKNTEQKILNLLDKIFITSNLDNLPKLEEVLHRILNVDNTTEYDTYLQTLYEWFSKCNSISKFRQYLSSIFREKGVSISDGKKYLDQATIVEDLLKLRQRFCDYERRIFMDLEIRSNIQSDFIFVFNHNSKMPEYLAGHIHNILRKEKEQDELDSQINSFMDLYKNLVDKDVFESFYKINLAKRLLCIKPTPREIENRVISRLKAECASFTATLEEMIKDIEISETHKEMFTDQLQRNEEPLAFEFTVKVLKEGLWKISSCSECNLPATFSSVFEVYHEFYNRHHNGRKLRLLNNLGDALITGWFANPKHPKQSMKYSFTVSTIQMLILILFNDQDSLTFKEIQELIAIDADRLKSSLIPITLRKPCHKILEKVGGDNKSIKPDDLFKINSNYSSKTRRIKLPFAVSKVEEVTNDSEGVWEKTEAERRFEIDAAIVRAMKARRVLTHVALVQEVISLLKNRFKPNVMAIDSRILQLIEKEYIQKKPNENSYVYLP